MKKGDRPGVWLCLFTCFLGCVFLLVFFLKFRYEHGGETVKVKDGAKSKFKKNHVAFSSSQRPDRRNGAGGENH